MSEDRRKILDMLSKGKISVDEAERLLEAARGRARGDGTARFRASFSIGGSARDSMAFDYSKMSRAIIVAARQGGGDPDANLDPSPWPWYSA